MPSPTLAERVAAYLGLPPGSDVADLLEEAQAMLDREIGEQDVPAPILDRATLMLCAELDLRARNPGGIVWQAGSDTAIRMSVDPMRAIRPMLGLVQF
jgi:hypothetical protein